MSSIVSLVVVVGTPANPKGQGEVKAISKSTKWDQEANAMQQAKKKVEYGDDDGITSASDTMRLVCRTLQNGDKKVPATLRTAV